MDNLTNPNANFFQQGQGGNPFGNVPLNTTPSTTNLSFPSATTLSSSQLSTPPVSTTPPAPTTNPSAFVGSLPTSNIEQQQPILQQRISELTRQLGGQTQDVTAFQTQAGLPEQTKSLADANLKLAQMQKEFQLAEQQAAQSGETLGFAQGRSQQVRQQAAIELGAQAARVQALQGNIETANKLIETTIKQKYEPLQTQLNYLIKNIELNYQNLDRADKRKADAALEKYRQQQLDLERQKLNESKYQFTTVKNADGTESVVVMDTKTGRVNVSGSPTGIGGNMPISQAKMTESLNTVNDINVALQNPALDSVFGIKGVYSTLIPGTASITAKSQIQQIIDKAALAARGQLKGQGAVSDFEGQMLKNAQSALSFTMNPQDARKELAKIKGAIITSSGGSTPVKITNKKTGESQIIESNTDGITKAIRDGLVVEYQ